MAQLTKDEARAIIDLLAEFYEGRTLDWDGKDQSDPAYSAAVKLSATAEIPMDDERMWWAKAAPVTIDVSASGEVQRG